MTIPFDECFFDVKVLFAGLNVVTPCAVAENVNVERILENNLIAQVAQTAKEVILQIPSNDAEPLRPVAGLNYRVRGHRLFAVPDDRLREVSQANSDAIAAPKEAFRRAIILLYGVELIDGGTFATEVDSLGNRRVHSYQFNISSLSVHYDAAYVWDENADEVRRLYELASNDYLTVGDGRSLAVAIDRLGQASIRGSSIDANLDLCIAAEITFLFGVKRNIDNEQIASSVRENARAFFGDGEFFWDSEQVAKIIRESYKERSDTVHGRKFDDAARMEHLMTLNVRLREVLKAALRAYVERRPAKLTARATWPERQKSIADGEPLQPIFT